MTTNSTDLSKEELFRLSTTEPDPRLRKQYAAMLAKADDWPSGWKPGELGGKSFYEKFDSTEGPIYLIIKSRVYPSDQNPELYQANVRVLGRRGPSELDSTLKDVKALKTPTSRDEAIAWCEQTIAEFKSKWNGKA